MTTIFFTERPNKAVGYLHPVTLKNPAAHPFATDVQRKDA